MIGRTILVMLLVMQTTLVSLNNPKTEEVTTNLKNEACCFCDDDELTTKEKCEELLWKALTDEKNWLDDGIITEEVYELQIEPFNKALDYLESGNATDEEIAEIYTQLLLANLDWLEEDKAAGEEIDEGFYNYINTELENNN